VFDSVYQRADGPIMANNFAYSDQITKYKYSPVEAIASLKNKLASTTLTVIDSGSNVSVAEKIKYYWEKIGVNVQIKVVPGEQAADMIKNHDFEVWHSSQIGGKGLNIANYSNPEVDKLLTDARATTDIEERKSLYQKFQTDITADVPAIFLYSPTYTYVQSKKIKGLEGSTIIEPADRFASINNWYLKTRKKLTW
jgi:ABC-type transport system substrate-binding protein